MESRHKARNVMHPRVQLDCSAFSLFEMLIVLSILSTLAVLFLSGGASGNQDRHLRQCAANLQKIHIALTLYADDHKDKFPEWRRPRGSESPLSALVPAYSTDTGIFTCPGTDDPPLPSGEPFAERTISYAYYMGWKRTDPGTSPLLSDRQIVDDADRTSRRSRRAQVIFSKDGEGPGANHDKYGGNVLFLDGSVRRYESKGDERLRVPDHIRLLNPGS